MYNESSWYRRRPLILISPHVDHETNEKHKPKPLGEILIAIKGDDPSGEDDVFFQLKMKIASFL